MQIVRGSLRATTKGDMVFSDPIILDTYFEYQVRVKLYRSLVQSFQHSC